MKKMKEELFRTLFAAIFSLVMATSCATTTLMSVQRHSSYKGGPLSNFLIIGVDTNPTVKQLLEDEFTEQLIAVGAAAVPSHTVFSEEEIPDKETILSKMKERGIDSVLIARVVDVQSTGTYESYPPYSSVGDFSVDYPACCEYISTGRDVFIETKIFDREYDKLIWSSLSRTIIESPSLKYSIESLVVTIVRNLRISKLLK
jgi:hypothetical protein